jgi:hypothetical protein
VWPSYLATPRLSRPGKSHSDFPFPHPGSTGKRGAMKREGFKVGSRNPRFLFVLFLLPDFLFAVN